jgi:hypothetical protein
VEPMTFAEIAALNDLIDEVSTHDGSGVLFRDPKTGRYCFAWENGHVDDQIGGR